MLQIHCSDECCCNISAVFISICFHLAATFPGPHWYKYQFGPPAKQIDTLSCSASSQIGIFLHTHTYVIHLSKIPLFEERVLQHIFNLLLDPLRSMINECKIGENGLFGPKCGLKCNFRPLGVCTVVL